MTLCKRALLIVITNTHVRMIRLTNDEQTGRPKVLQIAQLAFPNFLTPTNTTCPNRDLCEAIPITVIENFLPSAQLVYPRSFKIWKHRSVTYAPAPRDSNPSSPLLHHYIKYNYVCLSTLGFRTLILTVMIHSHDD